MAVDVLVMRRLLLVKGFLVRGEQMCRSHDPLDAMLALHLLHLACETALRAVAIAIQAEGVTQERQLAFMELVKLVKRAKADGKTAIELPYLDLVVKLNSRRNLTQHSGDAVHDEHLAEARVAARAFLEGVIDSAFGISLQDLSDLEYVEDEPLRELLMTARRLAETGGRGAVLALGAVRLAFERALWSWAGAYSSDLGLPSGIGLGFDVREAVKEVEGTIAMLATGVSPLDYRRLAANSPNVLTMTSGKIQVTIHRSEEGADADYVWAEAFVLESIREWQHRGFEVVMKNRVANEQFDELLREIREEQASESSSPATEASGDPAEE